VCLVCEVLEFYIIAGHLGITDVCYNTIKALS
jgi:hypothetical protein